MVSETNSTRIRLWVFSLKGRGRSSEIQHGTSSIPSPTPTLICDEYTSRETALSLSKEVGSSRGEGAGVSQHPQAWWVETTSLLVRTVHFSPKIAAKEMNVSLWACGIP